LSGRYRAAPAEDVEYLLDRLVEWLNDPIFVNDDPEIQFALIVAKAFYAHLHVAWIHPFGDGDGRTARLVEFAILAGCGHVAVPRCSPPFRPLQPDPNRQSLELDLDLDLASKNGHSTLGFLGYAIEGFIDGMHEVIGMVREQQIRVAWVNYVNERFTSLPNTNVRSFQGMLQ
jgi:Fic/DOC family